MILDTLKVLDIKRVGDLDGGIQAGIQQDSLPFIFDLVSKRLYSNPIGSVIREITSNCFDSHIEAGVDEPVIISRNYHAEEGPSIEFKDVGVGLSPDRVSNIYMNYFSSTKRQDNTQIGGFGIGSKTPLAYTDMFYITTIFDGTKYEYIFHKGENKPTLEILNQEETIEHNGTTIRIVMEKHDVDIFKEELQNQLAYFDNVYFNGWGVSNDYHIYEGKHFKFRSDINQFNTPIHLCIGKVRYPIDLNRVPISSNYTKIPVAVKFEIGELAITPSREALTYDDESIKLIKARVELAAKEILDMFEAQNPVIEDLSSFISRNKENPKLVFDKDKNHELYIWTGSGISKAFKFRPLQHLNIKKTPANMFFMWQVVGTISSGIYKEFDYPRQVDADAIQRGNFIITTKEDRMSMYTNIYINEEYGNYKPVIQRSSIGFSSISEYLGFRTDSSLGKAKTMVEYGKIIDGIVHEKGMTYASLRPTDEWIAEYKKSVIEKSAAYRRKKDNKVFIRDVAHSFSGREVSQLELEKRTGVLVYGFREHKAVLQSIYTTVFTNKRNIYDMPNKDRKGNYVNNKHKAFMVVQIAQAAEKLVVGAPKSIYWEDFLKTKFFRKIQTAHYINERLYDYHIDTHSLRASLDKDYLEDYLMVKESIKPWFRHEGVFSLSSKLLTDRVIPEMYVPLSKFIEKHGKNIYNIPLERYVDPEILDNRDSEDYKDYIKIVKSKKLFKLNTKFYLKTEKQLKYEEGVRQILRDIKTPPKNNLLTFTLNQLNNVNEEDSN